MVGFRAGLCAVFFRKTEVGALEQEVVLTLAVELSVCLSDGWPVLHSCFHVSQSSKEDSFSWFR